MLFLEIRRAACAAAAACALFAINTTASAGEDESYPAVATDVSDDCLDTEGIAEAAGDLPVRPRVTVPDSSIAAVMRAATMGEIVQSRLALKRASNPAVLAFAQRMIKHHTDLINEQSALLATLGAAPLANPTSRMLAATNARQLVTLLPLSGPEFDLAYMNAQIVDHRTVLKIVDTQLLPTARDPNVRDLLLRVRPVIAEHLAEAVAIQATLGTRR